MIGPRSARARARWWAPALATLLVAPAARATPLFEMIGGVDGEGGFNARTVAAGAASAYFNPAFLPDCEPGLELGVFALGTDVGITVEARPAGADIPVDSIHMERPGGGLYARHGIPTIWLQQGKPAVPPDDPLPARPRQGAGSGHETRLYQVVGFVHHLLQGRLGLGLYAVLPYHQVQGASAFYSDEREQYFTNSLHPELLGDRLASAALSFGVGARLHRKLSLGAAFTLALHTDAVTPTYVDDVGHFQDILVDSHVGVSASLAPHLGLVYTPVPRTRLIATAHSPQRQDIETNFSFLISDGFQQEAKLQFTHGYLPWIFAVGAAHDLTTSATGGITVAATALYALWSNYRDRHGENPQGDYAWHDTLAGTVGARYRHGRAGAFLDLSYQPTPVPDQTGRTNYVDNDRAATSFGVDYRTPLWGGTFKIGVQAQAHALLARQTEKTPPPTTPGATNDQLVVDEVPDDAVVNSQPLAGREGLQTNNPGWPGFRSAGWILGAGLNVSFTH